MAKTLIAVTCLMLCPFVIYAFEVEEFYLSNGIKVLVVQDHKAPIAVFQIWYKTGSKNEQIGQTGISHFLEHMMFKGTPKYASKVFSNTIARHGGSDNAFTSKDMTVYFQTIASDRIHIPIEMEADRMKNLLLDPKDLDAERQVIMEERKMRYEDDPQNLLYEEVIASAFQLHPYRWPVIGWMQDIASITREDMLAYYKAKYDPSNCFIVIAGDVTAHALKPLLEKHFGSIASVAISKPKAKAPFSHTSKHTVQKRLYLRKQSELPFLVRAYHTPSFPHEDSFALEVLASILADGKSSRLYKSIVSDQKLASSIFADYSGFYTEPFLFFIGAKSAVGKDIHDVEKAIDAHIEEIKTNGVSERELTKAKNQIESAFVFALDSNYSKAYYTGMFELLGSWRLMKDYLDGIKKVTAQDVKNVANKYLKIEQSTTGILLPN